MKQEIRKNWLGACVVISIIGFFILAGWSMDNNIPRYLPTLSPPVEPNVVDVVSPEQVVIDRMQLKVYVADRQSISGHILRDVQQLQGQFDQSDKDGDIRIVAPAEYIQGLMKIDRISDKNTPEDIPLYAVWRSIDPAEIHTAGVMTELEISLQSKFFNTQEAVILGVVLGLAVGSTGVYMFRPR